MSLEEEERVKQELVSFKALAIKTNNPMTKVSTPKISEEDKELQKMATTAEEGVRQDMVSEHSHKTGVSYKICCIGGHSNSLPRE